MFRAPLCPSSGAREYYTGGCYLSYLVFGFQVVGIVWSWGLCVRFAGCSSPSAPHHTDNLKTKAPNTTSSNHLYNTLELLMIGLVVPETCWASNKICNKNHLLHLVGILCPHINDDARSKSLRIYKIHNSKSTTTMAIVYGKTTLPSLPPLRKFPDNDKFFAMVIYIANVSQLAILLFHGGKDQWLHKCIVCGGSRGLCLHNLCMSLALNSLFLLYR
jgi:hypothetical protein